MVADLKNPRASGCVLVVLSAWTLLMAGFSTFMTLELVRRIREYRTYRETPCRILASTFQVERGSKGSVSYRVEARFEFEVDGRRHVATDSGEMLNSGTQEGAGARVETLAPGTTHPCWYDPTDPAQAVLERRLPHLAWFVPLPFCFTIFGLVMLHRMWTGNTLGRLSGFIAGISFSGPWLLFAPGVMWMNDPSASGTIMAVIFGLIGAAGIVVTCYQTLKSRGRTPP